MTPASHADRCRRLPSGGLRRLRRAGCGWPAHSDIHNAYVITRVGSAYDITEGRRLSLSPAKAGTTSKVRVQGGTRDES
jgi:hypothetical protein